MPLRCHEFFPLVQVSLSLFQLSVVGGLFKENCERGSKRKKDRDDPSLDSVPMLYGLLGFSKTHHGLFPILSLRSLPPRFTILSCPSYKQLLVRSLPPKSQSVLAVTGSVAVVKHSDQKRLE